MLAKTARKGKTPLYFLPSLLQQLGDTRGRLPFHLMATCPGWNSFPVVVAGYGFPIIQGEPEEWETLPIPSSKSIYCLYSPFSTLWWSTDIYPCLSRSLRGLQADGSMSRPGFLHPFFTLRAIANMPAKITTRALLPEFPLPTAYWYGSLYVCIE